MQNKTNINKRYLKSNAFNLWILALSTLVIIEYYTNFVYLQLLNSLL